MSFMNTVRKVAKIRFYASLFIVGLLFVVFGIIAETRPKAEHLSVDGMIDRIETYTDEQGEEQAKVFVSYTDKSGTRHKNIEYPSYSSSMKEGKTVEVLYDADSPEEIFAPGGEFMAYIFIAIGAVAMVVAIRKISAGMKKTESNSPFENNEKQVDPLVAEQIRNDGAPTKEYYFHWIGKMNQSYILETPERQPIYEAICDHVGVLSAYRYTFANRLTGATNEHIVSHTVTKSYGGGNGNTSVSVVASSEFKIDDINIWDYLADMGYSIELKRSGLKLNFDVLHHGVPVAFLEAAGTNILKDDSKSILGDKITGTGLFKVSCKESDLEGVFLACFTASRVEFF